MATLLEIYDKLIIKIASYYYRNLKVTHMDFDELVAEGQIGFMDSVKRFDTEKGFELSTFATYGIKNSILNAMRECSIIKISTRDILSQMNKNKDQNNEKTTVYNVDLIDTSENFELCMYHSSKSNETYIDDNLGNQFVEKLEKENLNKALVQALRKLSPQERLVIINYFGLNDGKKLNLKQIAIKYNMDYLNVRMIKKNALNKLKSFLLKSNNNNLDISNISY